MAKTIKQTAKFKVSPKEVYEALMDSKTHSRFTGGKAVISPKVGGKFTAYDGYCWGENLELVEGKKIVQSWTASDWPEGHMSKVTFALAKDGKGTKLTFTQTNVPDEFAKDIAQGWKDYYWVPMKEMFEK
jgi:activator of HSP90 ATPase